MQSQFSQQGSAPGREFGNRIFVGQLRQQRRKVADVLLEQIEDRGDPSLAEPHTWPHTLSLEFLGPGIGRLGEQLDACLGQKFVAEEIGRVRPEGQLRPGQHLGGVPVVGEVGRRDLQMQLHAGAGRLRRNRFGADAQPFRSGDVDEDVLAAGGEDGVVECLVAHRRTHPTPGEMVGHQRGQDADHHDVRAVGAGLGLGGVETGPDLRLQLQRRAAGQWPRRHIEFDVVCAQFGLIGRIGDRRQDLLVRHRGLVVGVDEVALDLHTGHGPVEVETGLREHCFEHIQAELHLAAVLLPMRPAVTGLLDLFAHGDDATG